jgi:NADH:ubiquinone oxidoreductase subunit E
MEKLSPPPNMCCTTPGPSSGVRAPHSRAARVTRRPCARCANAHWRAAEDGHRRDLLIENLHCLNDAFHGLFERHLVALAAEMRLAPVEVFEVASFYHHFEILKDDAAAPALVVRVCAGLSCEMAGARDLLARLPVLLGADVRVVEAPCIGRCEQAPAVLAGQQAVPQATPAAVVAAVKALGAPDVPPGTRRPFH